LSAAAAPAIAPALEHGRRHDVVIVGAGVVGLACALALLRAGRAVTVLDRGRIAGATSHGNCGTITPSHAAPLPMPGLPWRALRMMTRRDAPFYLKPRWDPALMGWLLRALRRCNRDDFLRTAAIKASLLTASRQLLADLVARERLDCGFRTNGSLYVFRSAQAFDQFAWHEQLLTRLGIAVETRHGAALRQLEPALDDSVVAGYLHPGDAHLRPDRLCAELARAVLAAGGTLVENCHVSAFAESGDAVTGVRVDGATVAADAVLLAAGTWSPALLRGVGVPLPVQPGKGYSLTFDRPALAPAIPLVLTERSVCVTAWDDGFRLGSTMEFAGFDASLNPVRLAALRRAAAEYLREPEGPTLREQWYGWRPMTPDDLPVIGPVVRRPGLWLATGHGMLGVTLAAVTAQVVAAQMTGAPAPLDVRALAPERFA
jgi:D-amino-acid dehydrogenase